MGRTVVKLQGEFNLRVATAQPPAHPVRRLTPGLYRGVLVIHAQFLAITSMVTTGLPAVLVSVRQRM
jgi:hypothetical protein